MEYLGAIIIALIIWVVIELFEGIGETLNWISEKLKTPMLVSIVILLLGTVTVGKLFMLVLTL